VIPEIALAKDERRPGENTDSESRCWLGEIGRNQGEATDLAGFERNRSRSLVLIEYLKRTWRGSQSHSLVPRTHCDGWQIVG